MSRRVATTGNEGWRTSPRPQRTDADRRRVHGPLQSANDNPRRAHFLRSLGVALLIAGLWCLATLAVVAVGGGS